MTKRMTRIGAAAGAAVLTIGLGAAAFAGGDEQGRPIGQRGGAGGPGARLGGPGRGGPMGPLAGLPLRQLNLSDAQREQVRVIMESHAPELQAIHDRIYSEVFQLLTPEQQAKAKEISDSRPQRPSAPR